MTEDEKAVHSFLNGLNIKEINIKNYLESMQRYDSPNVRKEFELQRELIRKNSFTSAASSCSSILARRKFMNNKQPSNLS